jgi:hypothetical protein
LCFPPQILGSLQGLTLPKRCKRYSRKIPLTLPPSGRGAGVRGQRSPRVMFSKRGEKQFVLHGTKAVEHFAEIFLHLMGNDTIIYLSGSIFMITIAPASGRMTRRTGKEQGKGNIKPDQICKTNESAAKPLASPRNGQKQLFFLEVFFKVLQSNLLKVKIIY